MLQEGVILMAVYILVAKGCKGSYNLHKAIDFYIGNSENKCDYLMMKCFQSNIEETEYFYRFNPYYKICYKELNKYADSLKEGDYGYKQIWEDGKND